MADRLPQMLFEHRARRDARLTYICEEFEQQLFDEYGVEFEEDEIAISETDASYYRVYIILPDLRYVIMGPLYKMSDAMYEANEDFSSCVVDVAALEVVQPNYFVYRPGEAPPKWREHTSFPDAYEDALNRTEIDNETKNLGLLGLLISKVLAGNDSPRS
jgi:hypothetical protein